MIFFLMVATAALTVSITRADHKKTKFEFLLTLLLEEKNKNEGGSYDRNSAQSTGAAGKSSQSVQ